MPQVEALDLDQGRLGLGTWRGLGASSSIQNRPIEIPQMPDAAPHSYWGTALLLALSSVFALTIGEGSARLLGLSKTWSSYLSAPDYISLEMITGELIGYRRLPSGDWPAPFGTRTRTNRAGFRGPELPQGGSVSGVTRLLYLGDSVAEGYGVSVEERFSERVQRAPTAPGSTRIESANLSVAGHSTVDQVAVWKRIGAGLTPDVVVVQIGDNDVAGNLGKLEAFESGDWDRANPGLVSSQQRCTWPPWPGANPPCSLKRFLQDHSALYLALAERYQALLIRSGHGTEKSVFLRPVPSDGWTATRLALTRLLEELEGVRTVLLYVPVEARVLAPSGSAPNGLDHWLRQDAELNTRATVLDVTAALRVHLDEGLFLDDVHLTRRGHEIVSAELLRTLGGDGPSLPVR